MFKKDSFTIPLLFGFIITLLLGFIATPWANIGLFEKYWSYWFGKSFAYATEPPLIKAFQYCLPLLFPLVKSMVDFLGYMLRLILDVSATSHPGENILLASLILMGFCYLCYYLETLHTKMRGDGKGKYQIPMCVNMFLIENIAMYLFSVVAHFVTQAFREQIVIPDLLGYAIAAFLIIVTVRRIILQIVYIAACSALAVVLPLMTGTLVRLLLHGTTGARIGMCVTVVMMMGAWVIWKLFSDKIYTAVGKKMGI